MSDQEKAIAAAAIVFARDHGPVPLAATGDSEAILEVCRRLRMALDMFGLKIEDVDGVIQQRSD